MGSSNQARNSGSSSTRDWGSRPFSPRRTPCARLCSRECPRRTYADEETRTGLAKAYGSEQQLVLALDEAIAILTAAGESHWPKWLEAGQSEILAGDPRGAEDLLQAVGGMGSLNDPILSPLNGHVRTERRS